jgi:hypothetical protein
MMRLLLLLPFMALAVASSPTPSPTPSPKAGSIPRGACFDLSTSAGVKPLSKPIPFSAVTKPDTIASGPHPEGGGWGSARALLPLPITQVLQVLRDQTTLKNPKESDVEVRRETKPGLVDWQSVDITIHPFPLISIEWTEQWAYKILQGTEAAPKEVLIAYQKTAGTDHIRHFCGNIWLSAEGDSPDSAKTDFAVYEETDATRRTAAAIAQGHLGTIRTIKEKAVKR